MCLAGDGDDSAPRHHDRRQLRSDRLLWGTLCGLQPFGYGHLMPYGDRFGGLLWPIPGNCFRELHCDLSPRPLETGTRASLCPPKGEPCRCRRRVFDGFPAGECFNGSGDRCPGTRPYAFPSDALMWLFDLLAPLTYGLETRQQREYRLMSEAIAGSADSLRRLEKLDEADAHTGKVPHEGPYTPGSRTRHVVR